MRFSQTPPSLLSLLFVALSNIQPTQAIPLGQFDFGALLLGRTTCVSYCGADNQFCCTQGQSCTTLSGNVATCMAGAGAAPTGGAGGYAVYTTTYTETDLVLRTSTYTSNWAAASPVSAASPATTGVVAICNTGLGETSCGPICCASNQGCAAANSCTARGTSWVYVPTGVASSGSYSAPLRPTSGGVSTATQTGSATTTQPFIPPATASGSSLPIVSTSTSHGLSGGAIAGIVIGTIAGILLLLLLCFCCIVRGLFNTVLAIFGLGKGKRRSSERVTVIEEERYSRHGSGAARPQHTGWFGGAGRPSRVTEERKKKSSGLGGFGAVGAGLLGLAAVLGLKRKSEHREKASASHAGRSDLSSSYYSYDSYTGSSPSSASSDDRRSRGTRNTRRSRR